MHDDQICFDDAAVRTMIADQFPHYRQEVIERLDSAGTDNAIFRIGSTASARFRLRSGDPADVTAALQAEAAAMAEFAQHCPFAAPRPIGFGRPGVAYPLPWLVQTWIDGDVATPDRLAASTDFAKDIVELIRSLRAVGTAGRHFQPPGRGGWAQHSFTRHGRSRTLIRNPNTRA